MRGDFVKPALEQESSKNTIAVRSNRDVTCFARLVMLKQSPKLHLVIIKSIIDKVYICIKFVSVYVLYEIMWNTCVTLIYSFILYILICTSRSLLQCCTSKFNVV